MANILRSGGAARPLLWLAALLLVGCTSYRVAPPAKLAPNALVVAPFVETIGPTNATVVWETRNNVYGWLTLAAPDTNHQVRSAACGHIQRVTLSGLTPGVAYQYRVSGSDQPWQRFTTLDPHRSNFVFVVFGDNRTGNKPFAEIARRITKIPADFAINTGDIVGQGSRHQDWFADWFVPGAPILAAMPVLVAWGNHEEPHVTGSWLQIYYRARSQFHGQAYFSYRQGPVHFIHLNCYEPLDLDSPQYRWCAQELAGSDAPFIAVAYHVSPLTGSNHARDGNVIEFRRDLVPLLARYNVSLSLTGHDHLYNRNAYAGTAYVIAGSSGAPLYSGRVFANPFSVLATTLYHYVVCTVSATQLTARVYGEQGALIDAFSTAPRPRRGAPPPAVASFDPPLHDYIEHETFNGQVYIRNFSAATVVGTINIDAPAAWHPDLLRARRRTRAHTAVARLVARRRARRLSRDYARLPAGRDQRDALHP
ncbi:MAG: metallophosphoesterase family protein [bacterium]|nr:metallophosphoesterase family protein [bacterium]